MKCHKAFIPKNCLNRNRKERQFWWSVNYDDGDARKLILNETETEIKKVHSLYLNRFRVGLGSIKVGYALVKGTRNKEAIMRYLHKLEPLRMKSILGEPTGVRQYEIMQLFSPAKPNRFHKTPPAKLDDKRYLDQPSSV